MTTTHTYWEKNDCARKEEEEAGKKKNVFFWSFVAMIKMLDLQHDILTHKKVT